MARSPSVDPGPAGRSEAVLVADSLGRSFRGREVLRAATLWAYAGEVSVLFGRNGSGKTTALRIAAGVLRPHWGTVRFRGRSYPRPRLHELARRGLMYIPQEGVLARGWTVGDQVRILTTAPASTVAAWAERWEVASFLDRSPGSLSGGERNRVSVAVAVLREPPCVLMDEPLTGAAPRDRELVTRMIRHLAGRGCALLVTGHEARELLDVADRVLLLSGGSSRDLGGPERAVDDPDFRREYLGSRMVGKWEPHP